MDLLSFLARGLDSGLTTGLFCAFLLMAESVLSPSSSGEANGILPVAIASPNSDL